MKDRVSTYPGRVKLMPVEGQANTYDMTRADVPQEPGTPLNQQTLLQPSTAQYLKLPYADPTVDDALRHMVDRVVPIGTIRTSPAQSLGDAWLKCDGSMVTFENYPQLCSVLRNTGGAVTWSTNTFPTTYTDIGGVSDPVFFDGKWLVAIRNIGSWVKILSASSLDGTWTEEASFTADNSHGNLVALSASENYCVCAYLTDYSSSGYKLKTAVKAKDAQTWTENEAVTSQYGSVGWDLWLDHCGDRFAALFGTYQDWNLAYSDDPTNTTAWTVLTKTSIAALQQKYVSFSCTNGQWFIISELNVYRASNATNFSFEDIGNSPANNSLWLMSKLTFYAGAYYFMMHTAYSNPTSGENVLLSICKSSDLLNWSISSLDETVTYRDADNCHLAASETMLVLAAADEVWTTSAPDVGYSNASISSMLVRGAAVKGMVAVVSTTTGIAYHDYTYDSRLLPTISLSDDTTTFIKAKNELDVFEAQAGGD